MTTRKPSDISKTARALTACLTLGCASFSAIEAKADGYAECNQILTQDIFNKITKNDSSSATSVAEAAEAFFSQDETQAWDTFSKASSEAKKNGTKIDAEFHYGVIGGELGIEVTSEKQVSESEFKQKFNTAKSKRGGNKSNKVASAQALVNTYASSIRDPGTVTAWKECVTKTKETNLYAFASRDKTGQGYVNVMWVPGALAGTLPSISVDFVTDGDAKGVKVHATPKEQIAMGSGRSFAVTCGTKCDDGFLVTVNGTLKNAAGVATSSFTTTVEVPPKAPKVVDLCQTLGGHAIYLNANGYNGVVGPEGIALQKTDDGSFRFATSIMFSKETNLKFSTEIKDSIAGTCQGTTVNFTRKLRDASAQRYSGIVSKSPGGDITIEGSFSDENNKKYPWSGRVENPIP